MDVSSEIGGVATLIGEPARAVMLWSLLDGEARPAGELALQANVSAQSASTHLAKLLKAGLLSVERRGRHRYYRLGNPEVAHAVEALVALLPSARRPGSAAVPMWSRTPELAYARRCYDHLAGKVAVAIADGLLRKGWLVRAGKDFTVAEKGAHALCELEIDVAELATRRRVLARQCLDWSERRPHVAGALGGALLERLLARRWVASVRGSRILRVTLDGRAALNGLLSLGL
jgi:DNA-binding transcriptional ArsR family regulator